MNKKLYIIEIHSSIEADSEQEAIQMIATELNLENKTRDYHMIVYEAERTN